LKEKYLAIPMVCFCDIPLKFISKTHIRRYGKYGIGFKKEWGISKNISPILYRIKNSNFENAFNNISRDLTFLESLVGNFEKNFIDQSRVIQIVSAFQDNSSTLVGFIKPYMDKKRNNYVDREWRWVPDKCENTFHKSKSDQIRIELNKRYHQNPDKILFDYEDINYLIVRNKNEIELLIDFIMKLEIDLKEKGKLIQKIIDLESVNLDM
jgi:hypothetical protein